MGRELDGRHRDVDGTIDRKHGNTRIDTLRGTYVESFAPDIRGDAKLETLLERENCSSLSEYLRRNRGK
jgi:hypothetical protein